MLAIDIKDKILLIVSALMAAYAAHMLVKPAPITFQTRVNSVPIAKVITFSNIVKKKPAQSVSWANISKANELYQGDQVFTHNDSFAEIVYKNSTSLNLLPNTLLKIEENSDGFNVDLKKGFLSLNFKNGKSKRVNLKIGNKNLVLSGKSALLQIDSNKMGSNITVLQGKANVRSNSKGSKSKVLESGDALKINASKGKIEITKSDIFPSFPKRGETITSSSDAISFKWSNKKDFGDNLKLVLSKNAALSDAKIINVKGSSHSIDYLPPGSYYWQVKAIVNNKTILGPISYFKIPNASAPRLATPIDKAEYLLGPDAAFEEVKFKWSGKHQKGFLLSLKPEAGAARELEVASNQTNIKLKKGDIYTWKVKVNEKSSIWSKSLVFTVKRDNFIKAIFPPAENIFNVLSLKESVKFNWSGPKKKKYVFQLFEDQLMEKEVLNKIVVGNNVQMKMKKFGKYFWKVSSQQFPDVTSQVLPFSVLASIASLSFPKDKQSYALVTSNTKIKFKWKNLGLKRYPSIFQVSRTENFEEMLIEEDVKKPNLTLPFESEGVYFWRIVSKDKELSNVSNTAVRSFKLSLPAAPNPPKIAKQQILELLKGYNIEQYAISWPKIKYAKKYIIEIYEKEDLKTRITRAKVKSTKILWRGERSGAFFYRVKVIDQWNRKSGWSKTGRLIAPISPFD